MKAKDLIKVFAWDILNPFLLSLKKKKVYPVDDKFHGVNIGCGIDCPAEWIGLDGGVTHYLVGKSPKAVSRMFFKVFNMSKNYSFEDYYKKAKSTHLIHHEITYGLPFRDNSVPNIFSSHFFEHLAKKDADFLAKECFRVLKPGGTIRITVPGLDQEVQKMKEAIDKYIGGDYESIQPFVTRELVGFNSKYSNHRYMYNSATLKKLLADAGFINLEDQSFGQGKISDVSKLDTRNGIFVEGVKT